MNAYENAMGTSTAYRPKRPPTPFMRFSGLMRSSVAAKHPEMKFGDIGKEIGRLYRAERNAGTKLYQLLVDEAAKEREILLNVRPVAVSRL